MKIHYITGSFKEPNYGFDAGFDLVLLEDLILAPGEAKWVQTDVTCNVPIGTFATVIAKSCTLKRKIFIPDSVIDTTYDRTFGYLIVNASTDKYTFKKGDSVGQLVFIKTPVWFYIKDEQVSNRWKNFVKWLSKILYANDTRYSNY